MARVSASKAGGQNVIAFLDMIAHSEGTAGRGDDGYNVIVNPGGLFTSYSAHPNKLVQVRDGLKSTAAGRYQFIHRTWMGLAPKLNLHDFSPVSQDLACIELIRENGAFDTVVAGYFAKAVELCAKTWASLPGAGYGQHENKLEGLQAAYIKSGGVVA